MYRIVAIAALMLIASVARGQQLVELFDIGNRQGRDLPVVVVRLDIRASLNVTRMQVRRCDTDAQLPFYVEPWTVGKDSTVCWVRIDNLPRSGTVTVKVVQDPQQTVSRSSGTSTFLAFQERITPANATSAAGPFTKWQGTPPAFGSGLLVEAQVRATNAGGGLFAFFGLNDDVTDAYVVQHDARASWNDADLYRIQAGAATNLSTESKRWAVNDSVRYAIRLRSDSVTILRSSTANAADQHAIRVRRNEAGGLWRTFGVASMPGQAGSFAVDWVRVRPLIEPEPSITRRPVEITKFPGSAVVCGNIPVILTAPAGWTSYRWSNGGTDRNVTVLQAGSYSCTVQNAAGCSVTLPAVAVQQEARPAIGNDTAFSLCLGKKELLRVRPGLAAYAWYISTGQTRTKLASVRDTITIDSADIYTCIGTTPLGCADTVLFRINRVFDTTAKINSPSAMLTICDGDSLQLEAQPPFSSYQWLRNGVVLADTAQRLIVRDSGQYTVRVRIGGTENSCVSVASVMVRYATPKPLTVTSDTTICEGDSVVFDIPDSFTRVEWRRNSSTFLQSRLVVRKSDTLDLTASIDGACAVRRQIKVTVLPSPAIDTRSVDGRMSVCRGERLDLEIIGDAPTYLWRRNDTNQGTTKRITITQPGKYVALAVYANGCVKADTIVIDDGLAEPQLIALDGQAICEGDSTRLTTSGRFQTYKWSTGDTSDTIWVTKPGLYTVDVTLFECSASSSILIEPADPRGPGIDRPDTVSVCPAEPNLFVRLTNQQNVPRRYFLQPLRTDFTIAEPSITVPPNATASVPVTLVGAGNPRVLPCPIVVRDDCRWVDTIDIVVDFGPKDIPLTMALSGGSQSVMSGDDITFALQGTDVSGLRRFRWNDTVWLRVRVDPDLFQIRSASAPCYVNNVVVDDTGGTVTYMLTDCGMAGVEPFISQQLTVLTGSTLSATIVIDSVRGSNPCFAMPTPTRVIDVPVVPYGCELSTIQRPLSPAIKVLERGDGYVVIGTEAAADDAVLSAVDMLGRTITTQHVPAGTTIRHTILAIPRGMVAFIHAVNSHGATSIPVMSLR